MAYTSRAEVQTAMYNLLMPGGTLDATLATLGITSVYDWMNVPQNATFDYLTLGDGYEMPQDTLGDAGHSNGYILYANVHLWSRQRNTANPNAVIDRCHQLFHRQPLTLATLTHVYTLSFRVTPMIDATGTIPILHINNQYKIYTVQQ